METKSEIIKKADFNPNIKVYVLLVTAFILFISVIGIPFLIIWFIGLGQNLSKKFYQNLECTLTSKHLEFKKGVLFKVEKTIPLENIQDLTFIENPLLKLLDLRILKIETAGQSNPQGSDMKLIGIIDAANFKKEVLQQREHVMSRNFSGNQEKDTSVEKTNALLEEIKNILNDIKNK